MIQLDLRLVIVMVLTAVVTAGAPVALGGAIAIVGVIAAILAARSVTRSDEGGVTAAIVAGGLVAAATLSRGPAPALLVVAGVFAGCELAALGRRLAVDPEAPAAPEVKISAATIGLGAAAGGVVAVVSLWHARPAVANVALAVLLLVGAVAFATRQLRRPTG